MVTIDAIETELVIEGSPQQQDSEQNLETRKEVLREVVRELLVEELERYLRTEVTR